MKIVNGLLISALSIPAAAGLIRHDLPDSLYTGFGNIPEFQSVGLIQIDHGDGVTGMCSGTVIHKNWVLTAAHCLTNAKSTGIHVASEGGWRFHEASAWENHKNFNADEHFGGWDIGLMYFDTDLDATIAPLYTDRTELFNYAYSAGFGWTGDGYSGIQTEDYQRRAGSNIIDGMFSLDGDGAQLLMADFDHPTDPSYNLFSFEDATFDDLATFQEIMMAFGDSGGGLFIFNEGQLQLAGVHSFIVDATPDGMFGYGDFYASTRVSSFTNWINSRIKPVSVPESSSIILLLMGALAVFWKRRSE